MKKDPQIYLQDIITSIHDIEIFIEGMSYAQFSKDKKTLNAVIRSLEVMGEAVKNLPAGFKNKHPEIPWKKIAGMRDKLIHEYFGIDIEIIWQVIEEDIPSIKPKIKKLYL